MAAELFQKVLLLLGADVARREVSNQIRSLGFAALAYVVLAVFIAVALGFATAAAYVALANAYGTITACLVVSAVFLTLGIIAFFAISAQRKPPQIAAVAQPVTLESALSDLQKPFEDLIAKNGLKSVAVAGAAAFVAASLLRKRN